MHTYNPRMGEISDYETEAWRQIQDARDKWWRRAGSNFASKTAAAAGKTGERASRFVDDHPRFRKTVDRTGALVKRGAHAVGKAVPQVAKGWTIHAAESAGRTVRDASRVGLSPERVVVKHQKKGHPVEQLCEVRELDLSLVDKVRGKNFALGDMYPLVAAGSGGGAGLAITGGQLTLLPTAGASAAAGPVVVTGAIAADFTVVLATISRAVGAIALSYGYDPKQLGEKLFVSAVINAGAAGSSTAKTAAMKDLSRLAQSLVRNRTWAELNETVISQAVTSFGKAMSVKFTKKSLGKLVPAIGIVIGATFNYDTVARTIETADLAYRRRFLLDKYPHLADDEEPLASQDEPDETEDDGPLISVLDILLEEGGPDLRDTYTDPARDDALDAEEEPDED